MKKITYRVGKSFARASWGERLLVLAVLLVLISQLDRYSEPISTVAASLLLLFLIGVLIVKIYKSVKAYVLDVSQGGDGGEFHGFHWPPQGEYAQNIVGESFCQAPIERLHLLHGVKHTAELHPLPNKHDKNAVSVSIQGVRVGHLSRDDAVAFRARLKKLGMGEGRTYCDAKITGGFKMLNGESANFGIVLDITPL